MPARVYAPTRPFPHSRDYASTFESRPISSIAQSHTLEELRPKRQTLGVCDPWNYFRLLAKCKVAHYPRILGIDRDATMRLEHEQSVSGANLAAVLCWLLS